MTQPPIVLAIPGLVYVSPADGKLLRQWLVSWQHIESSAMVVDEEVRPQKNPDRILAGSKI